MYLLNQAIDDLSSRSFEANAFEALEETFDFASYMEMPDADLMNQALPDSLEIERKDNSVS